MSHYLFNLQLNKMATSTITTHKFEKIQGELIESTTFINKPAIKLLRKRIVWAIKLFILFPIYDTKTQKLRG
jgi:hypothetical protein